MVDVATLKRCPLFRGFTDTGLNIFAAVAQPRAFPRGTPLFTEDTASEALLIIAEGTVRLSARTPGGEDVALGEVGPGEPLGELALVQQGRHLCTATAATDVRAVELRHEEFRKLLAAKPQACAKLLMGIVGHFGQTLKDNREALRSLVGRR